MACLVATTWTRGTRCCARRSASAGAEGDCWFLAAASAAGHGFNPGIAFVPGTGVLFAGAGTRLPAYALKAVGCGKTPRTRASGTGRCTGPMVLMTAELVQVASGLVELDVMGTRNQVAACASRLTGSQEP